MQTPCVPESASRLPATPEHTPMPRNQQGLIAQRQISGDNRIFRDTCPGKSTNLAPYGVHENRFVKDCVRTDAQLRQGRVQCARTLREADGALRPGPFGESRLEFHAFDAGPAVDRAGSERLGRRLDGLLVDSRPHRKRPFDRYGTATDRQSVRNDCPPGAESICPKKCSPMFPTSVRCPPFVRSVFRRRANCRVNPGSCRVKGTLPHNSASPWDVRPPSREFDFGFRNAGSRIENTQALPMPIRRVAPENTRHTISSGPVAPRPAVRVSSDSPLLSAGQSGLRDPWPDP